MKALPVESRIIKSLSFSQHGGKLMIVFKNGEKRWFIGVPEERAMQLVAAPSPGQHYIDHIRQNFKRIA